MHGVVEVGSERISYCRCGVRKCPDIRLEQTDLIVYELDWRQLGSAIQEALELTAGYLTDPAIPNYAVIGQYRPTAIDTFLAVLVTGSEERDLESRVDTITVRAGRPFILLLPTRRFFNPAIEARMKDHASALLPLDEILTFSVENGFECAGSPWDALLPFGRRHVPSLSDEPGNRPGIPLGTRWGHVEVSFLTGLDVQMVIRGKPHLTDLIRLKLVRREDGNLVANEQGKLLKEFVARNGHVPCSADSRDRTKKQCQRLSAALREYLSISGDPISPLDNHSGWKANFQVKGFNAPYERDMSRHDDRVLG